MTPSRFRPASGLADEAITLLGALRADGRHNHVTVRSARGRLYVDVDAHAMLRLDPLGAQHYGVSFHHHTGRWEPTPFTGPLEGLADLLLSAFGPHLESWDFPPTMSGSDH